MENEAFAPEEQMLHFSIMFANVFGIFNFGFKKVLTFYLNTENDNNVMILTLHFG